MQNYHEDLKALLKDKTAHMFIAMLKMKKAVDPGLFFDYQADEENLLKDVFGQTLLAEDIVPYLEIFCHLTPRQIGIQWSLSLLPD